MLLRTPAPPPGAHLLEVVPPLVVRPLPGIVGGLPPTRDGGVEDQSRDPVRSGRGEHRAEGAGIGEAGEHGTLGPDRVEHRGEVVGKVLERREVIGGVAVGDAGPAPVDHDHAGE